jgi:hypothetical protein
MVPFAGQGDAKEQQIIDVDDLIASGGLYETITEEERGNIPKTLLGKFDNKWRHLTKATMKAIRDLTKLTVWTTPTRLVVTRPTTLKQELNKEKMQTSRAN